MKFIEEYKEISDLLNCKYDTIALTGGRGSGKTQHVIRAVLLAMAQTKRRVCFFRETKDTVAESLMAEAVSIIEEDFPNKGFSSTKDEINHLNGSKIFYKGLKEINLAAIENLKGIASSTDIFVIDEGQTISKAVLDVLIPTLRKKGSILIVMYNRIKNDLPLEEALFLDYTTLTAPQGTFYTEVNYTVLEAKGLLSARFLNRANLLKKNKPKEYEAIYLNKAPNESDRAVVKNFTNENIVDCQYVDDLPLHLTWDFNVDPMSCILAHKTDKKVFYFDEVILENSTTQQTIDEVIRRYPNHKSDIIINGDASGDNRSTQSEYSNYIIIRNALKKHYPHTKIKFDIPARNPAIMDRILAFNQMVYNDNGERNLFVSPKCERLLYNVKNLMFKIGTFVVDVPTYSQIKTNPILKFLEHPYDAASYLVEFYFPIKRAKIEKN